MATLGAIFPPDLPPERLRPVAVAADDAGLEQLWLWEDCFKESGIATAAAALAWTRRLTVGIGLLPVPLRNVALTAMELATLERLFPGRTVPGIGHGVLDWMAQVGSRAESPMTLLREYTAALYGLLHGETVTTAGRYVHLDAVALDWPPQPPPPLLVGAGRAKTAALAGELSDGVVFSGETPLDQLRELVPVVRAVRSDREPDVVVFVPVAGTTPAPEIAAGLENFVEAGATHLILLDTAEDSPLEEFVAFVARDVRPLID